jgi:hypothetical protein
MRPLRTAAALGAATLALAGCAHASAHASARASTPPPRPAACASAATTARITVADDHTTVCLAAGGTLDVFLSSTPERKWAPVTLDGTALAARPSGVGALAIGVTGAFYRAAGPGTAHLTSSRLACVDPGPNCGPADFDVTVIVP